MNHAFAGIIQQAARGGNEDQESNNVGTKRPRAQKTLSFSEFTDYIIEHKCRCEKDPVAPSKHFEGLGDEDLLWNYLETRDANKMIPIYQQLLTRIRFFFLPAVRGGKNAPKFLDIYDLFFVFFPISEARSTNIPMTDKMCI